jgi:uncharacterized protein YdhG (YjbR/CyaY superfamily)
MTTTGKSRESHFPSIEKKYGEKMSYWFKVMEKIKDQKYPEQISHLRENYGFSQAHANALVMYSKGSKSTSKFKDDKDYFKSIDPKQAKTIKAIYKLIQAKHKKLELVIAWNQPMLRIDKSYVIGAGVTKNYILLNPFSKKVMDKFDKQLAEYDVNKHTFAIPNDWKIDQKLILALVKARLDEIK